MTAADIQYPTAELDSAVDAYVADLAATWPELSAEQLGRLRVLLAPEDAR